MLFSCDSSFFHTYVGVVNLQSGCHMFFFSAAQQQASLFLNCMQIVTAVHTIQFQSGYYGGDSAYESILMIHLCSKPSSEKSKCSSPSTIFFIPILMTSNDECFASQWIFRVITINLLSRINQDLGKAVSCSCKWLPQMDACMNLQCESHTYTCTATCDVTKRKL